jgi:hypothetical protein
MACRPAGKLVKQVIKYASGRNEFTNLKRSNFKGHG